jgi:hypothetical protein
MTAFDVVPMRIEPGRENQIADLTSDPGFELEAHSGVAVAESNWKAGKDLPCST